MLFEEGVRPTICTRVGPRWRSFLTASGRAECVRPQSHVRAAEPHGDGTSLMGYSY